MKQTNLDFLRQNRTALTDNIDFKADQFLNNLLDAKVLTKINLEHIQKGDEVSIHRVGLLLDAMEKKTDEQFEQFCVILHKSEGQAEAAKILRKLPPADFEKLFGKSDGAVAVAKAVAEVGAKGGVSALSDEDEEKRLKKILENKGPDLITSLNTSDGLFDYLIRDGVITRRQKGKWANLTREERAEKLIDYLIDERPLRDIRCFIQALRITNQGHLADYF